MWKRMKMFAALLLTVLMVSVTLPAASVRALTAATSQFGGIVGTQAFRDDNGTLISFNPKAWSRQVSFSTDGGITWSSYTLSKRPFNGSAAWDSSTDTLWVLWADDPVSMNGTLYVNFTKIQYTSGKFAVTQTQVDSLAGGSSCFGLDMPDVNAFIINGIPTAVYSLHYTGTNSDQFSVKAATINPANSKVTLRKLDGSSWLNFHKLESALVVDSGQTKVVLAYNYNVYSGQWSLKSNLLTITTTGAISSATLQNVTAPSANDTMLLATVQAVGQSYWIDYALNGTQQRIMREWDGINKPFGQPITGAGGEWFSYSTTGSTVYAQKWNGWGWGAKEAWVPDVSKYAVISGTARQFLVEDQYTGFTYYYQADIPIPDQLSPPTGAYKTATPTFTWTTPYAQAAFQLKVEDNNVLLFDSGKIASASTAYTLPVPLARNRPYRVSVQTWNQQGYQSWHSSTSVYEYDPRSSLFLNAVADTYIKSSSPSSNFGTQPTMTTSFAKASYSLDPDTSQQSYIKFDPTSVQALNARIWESRLSLTTKRTPKLRAATANVVSDAWTETGLTWNSQPGASLANYPDFTRSGSTYNWSIPGAAYSLMVDTVENAANDWITREDPVGPGPKLQVFYSKDPNAPVPTQPTGPTNAQGSISLSWYGSDPDTDPQYLTYDLEFSYQGGPWQAMAYAYRGQTYTWNVSGLQAGSYTVRIRAHDGLTYSGWATFPQITVLGFTKPYVTINTPAASGVYGSATANVNFTYTHPYNSPMTQAIVQVASDPGFSANVQTKTVWSTNTSIGLWDGSWYLRVKAQEANGLWSDWSQTVMFTADLTAPGLTLTRTSAALTRDRSVNLKLSATDSASGVRQMQVTTNTGSPGAWVPFMSDYAYMLPASDGAYTVYARVADAAGNQSGWQNVPVTLDSTPPVVASAVINKGATRTDGVTVTLDTTVTDNLSGVATMQVSNDGVNWSAPMTYKASLNWMIAAQPGVQTVYARFYDGAGNMVQADDSILFMPDNAEPSVDVVVNGGTEVTYSNTVSVVVSANDNTTPQSQLQMHYSVGADKWQPWVPYSNQPFNVTLPSYGKHDIYVQVQDTNGNIGTAAASVFFTSASGGSTPPPNSQANTIFEAVQPDGTIGSLVSLNLFGEQLWAAKTTVLQLKGATAGKQYSTSGADWADVQGKIIVSAPPGPFSLWLRYQLGTGIYSDPVQYKFLYDAIAPDVTAQWLNGATATSNGSAKLVVTAKDNTFETSTLNYRYSLDDGATWTAMSATPTGAQATVNLGSQMGQRAVLVQVADPVGNTTSRPLVIWNL